MKRPAALTAFGCYWLVNPRAKILVNLAPLLCREGGTPDDTFLVLNSGRLDPGFPFHKTHALSPPEHLTEHPCFHLDGLLGGFDGSVWRQRIGRISRFEFFLVEVYSPIPVAFDVEVREIAYLVILEERQEIAVCVSFVEALPIDGETDFVRGVVFLPEIAESHVGGSNVETLLLRESKLVIEVFCAPEGFAQALGFE